MKMMFLSRADIEKVLDMKSTIEGVREVYRLKSLGRTAVWPLISYDFDDPHGVMDIKSGCVFGRKRTRPQNAQQLPGNARRGLPVFTGVLMIFDSETGIPQGVMDASFITCMRTGAAGALGASLLARPESHRLFILGAGRQAMFRLPPRCCSCRKSTPSAYPTRSTQKTRASSPRNAASASRMTSASTPRPSPSKRRRTQPRRSPKATSR